jgi:hypothetical protein
MKAGRYCGRLLRASRQLEFLNPQRCICESLANVFLSKVRVEPKDLSVDVAGRD